MENLSADHGSQPRAENRIIAAGDIEQWMVRYLSELLKLPADEIDREEPFEGLGLDSAAAIAIVGELEEWLNIDIEPTAPYDYPTINQFASYLHGKATT